MRTRTEARSMHAAVSFKEAELHRAMSLHLLTTTVEWDGHEVDLTDDGDAIDIDVNGATVRMGLRYVVMNGRFIDFIVLDGTPKGSNEWQAVVITRDDGDWQARQALYCYPDGTEENETRWTSPPLSFFL